MEKEIENRIAESIACKRYFMDQVGNIGRAVNEMSECFKRDNMVLTFGNGGSAADAQHIAGELVGRFKLNRRGLPAIALSTDSSVLTSLANDYGYEIVFERQVEALATKRDILLGISTSGKSKNVIRALEKGREIGTINLSLTGGDGGPIKELSDININSSSTNTPRVQECHILAYHIICELVEKDMEQYFSRNKA